MSMNETAGPRPLIPALAKVYAPLAPYGFAFIRIVIGLFIARHGYPKLFEGGTAGLAAGMVGCAALTHPTADPAFAESAPARYLSANNSCLSKGWCYLCRGIRSRVF